MESTKDLLKQILNENKKLNERIDVLSKKIEVLEQTKNSNIHYHFHDNNIPLQPSYVPATPYLVFPFNDYPVYYSDINYVINTHNTSDIKNISFNLNTSSSSSSNFLN